MDTVSLIEGVDYYIEGGFMVFTEAYHLKRGYCCDSDCRHCPWREATQNPRQKSDENGAVNSEELK
ncbi:MAG TPA: DUF5522 domain-containing protein [Blastocatellia bacterium]|nr:DUF5522 domain-containing protein [Blastocatellia bacterium]